MTNLSEKLKRIFGTIAYGTGVMLGNICDKKSVFDVVNDLAQRIDSGFLTSVDKSDFKSLNRWLEDHKFDKSFADKLQALIDTPSLNSVVVDIIVTNINSTKTSAANGTPRSRLDYKARDVATLSRIWLSQYDTDRIKKACEKSAKYNTLGEKAKQNICEILETACRVYLEEAFDNLTGDYQILASVIIRSVGNQISRFATEMKSFAKSHPIRATRVNVDDTTIKEILTETYAYTIKCPHCGNTSADFISYKDKDKYLCGRCNSYFVHPNQAIKNFIEDYSKNIQTNLSGFVTQLDHKLNAILQQTIAEGATTRSHITDEAVKTRSHMSTVGEKIEEKIDDTNAQMNAGFNSIHEMLQQLKDAKQPSADQTTSARVREDFPKGSAYRASFQKVPPSSPISTTSRRRTILTNEIHSRDAIIENGLLKKYRGSAVELALPDSITGIDFGAFSDCTSLSAVALPDSITRIGICAFSRCTSLVSINIPSFVTRIDAWAFSACSSLPYIAIPDSVKKIGVGAFHACESLLSITIPDSLTRISAWTFSRCASLFSIALPSAATRIDAWAFRGCESLSSITLPNSITRISAGVFSRCASLTSIILPNSVTRIGAWAFSRCASITSITISRSVTRIGAWAFSRCVSLTSIAIPKSVTKIGAGAFRGCESLTSITIPDSVESIGPWAFDNCFSLRTIRYGGTKDQWKRLRNKNIENCQIIFNAQ